MTHEQQQIYIQKRALILKILEGLIGFWNLAEGLYALVLSIHITPEAIDGIEQAISQAQLTSKNQDEKQKIEQALNAIKNLKEIEASEREEEQKIVEIDSINTGLFL
jgi:divalent metal cation (Fe/Co/Zn/Cd) transporter